MGDVRSALVERALEVLRAERPDIARAPFKITYTGFSSIVGSTGSGFIVRVGRTPQAAESHERGWRLLPLLAGLPGAVPAPVWQLPPGPEAPFGAVAYPMIEGSSLPWDRPCPAALVDQLALFLAELHAITDPTVRAAVDSLGQWRGGRLAASEAAIGHLARDLAARDHARLVRWFDEVYEPWMQGIDDRGAVVVHGDFWHDNLLIGPAGLTGSDRRRRRPWPTGLSILLRRGILLRVGRRIAEPLPGSHRPRRHSGRTGASLPHRPQPRRDLLVGGQRRCCGVRRFVDQGPLGAAAARLTTVTAAGPGRARRGPRVR